MSDSVSILLKAIYFIIVFGIIIFFAYYGTRILGRKISGGSGRYMKVIDVLPLGSDRALLIVKVDEEYLLMSSSAKGIDIIKDLKSFSGQDGNPEDGFDSYLHRYKRVYKDGMGILRGLGSKFAGRDDTNG